MANDFARPTANNPATVKDVFTNHETQYKKLTVLLDPDLHKQFQRAALEDDRTMTDVIKEKITEYIEQTLQNP